MGSMAVLIWLYRDLNPSGHKQERKHEVSVKFDESRWPEIDEALARFLDWVEDPEQGSTP